jgi:hypothetical protein
MVDMHVDGVMDDPTFRTIIIITFLPFSDFEKCAKSLDRSRLGNQRSEAMWLLEILIRDNGKFGNQPLVKMLGNMYGVEKTWLY